MPGGWGWGRGAALHLTLHCHHHSDLCIKLDSDESQFTVSFIVRGKVTRQCPQTTTVEEKGEPKWGIEPMSSAYQPNALALGKNFRRWSQIYL